MAPAIRFGHFIPLCLLTIVAVLKTSDCSGRLQIYLKTYEDNFGRDVNGSCCDGLDNSTGFCKPCDHFIFACLLDGRDHGQGPCVSNNVTTEAVNNSNSINFTATVGRYPNPFQLNFDISARTIVLLFSTYDEDKYDTPSTEPQLLENTTYVIYSLNPTSNNANASFSHGEISTNISLLTFDYRFQCAEYYYSKCDKYCRPDPLRYTCDGSGNRQCMFGWFGQSCTAFDFCYNSTCFNGGTCKNKTSGFTCNCPTKYTGVLCDTMLTTATTTAVQTILSTRTLSTKASLFPTSPSSKTMIDTSASSTSTTSTSTTTTASSARSSTITNTRSSRYSATGSTARFFRSSVTSRTSTATMVRTINESTNKASVGRQSSQQSQKNDKSVPVHIGIIIGAVAGGLVLLGGITYFIIRKKNKIRNSDENHNGQTVIDW